MEANVGSILIKAGDLISNDGGSGIDLSDVTKYSIYLVKEVRNSLIVPLVRIAVFVCLVMTIMILVEKLFVGIISLVVKIWKLKPERRYKWEPIVPDVEKGSTVFPMVLVQIPMYNEKEVYKLSIRAACGLKWPSDRMIIQVLDDSTDPVVKNLVSLECRKWKSEGVNIRYEVRGNRKGYKAGALKEGMKHKYVQECEYIAMFDADFQPESDFLLRTIPFLVHNPEIALVQARWKFVNADECLMTRLQEMSLDYHFKIEQEAGSSCFAFFGFNGTAGVWRIKAIADAGGWKDRTTVEDMDLAVRAGLRGWSFLYVGDLKVKSELPSTFKAFRYQQHRWSCGPANLFKKMAVEIMQSKKKWRSLSGNVMSLHRTKAAITGLLDAGRVNEWVVTEKLGEAHKTKPATTQQADLTENLSIDAHEQTNPFILKPKNQQTWFWHRFYYWELSIGTFILLCGYYDVVYAKEGYFIYLFLQGLAFLITGFGCMGTHLPDS